MKPEGTSPSLPSTAPTYLSDPQVQYLSQVLDEVRRGNLLIPRFQREFVWKPEQQLELLRSVRDGIPIGSLLVWRTSKVGLKTFTRLAGHVVPGPPEPTPGAPRQYLLDGHQRLSTLFGALHRPPPGTPVPSENTDDPQEPASYFYDLDAEDFCLGPVNLFRSTLLPTNILFDSIGLLKFQRELVGRKNGEELIARADRLANAFRNYKVPLVPLVTDNLEDATKAFQRINSSGTAMSDFHMVAALTFTDQFDFAEKMEEATTKLAEVGWEKLDEKYILATVRAHAGLRIVSPDADSTSQAITQNHHLLDEATENLRRAAKFLLSDCGVPSPQLLPYSYQAVVLAEAFRNAPEAGISIREALTHWFWHTTYLAYFLGARDNDVNDALNEARELARAGKSPSKGPLHQSVEALPKRHDFRNARSKAFLLRLATLGPQAHDGVSFNATQCLAAHEARATIQLITSGGMTAKHYNGPENRFIVEPEKASAFREHLLQGGSTLPKDFLASHAVTDEAAGALVNKDYPGFLTSRRRHLLKLEEDFVSSLGLQYQPDLPA